MSPELFVFIDDVFKVKGLGMNPEIKAVINVLKLFEPRKNLNDNIWEFYFSVGRKWHYLKVTEYKAVYYFSGNFNDSVDSKLKSFREYETKIFFTEIPKALRGIYKKIKKNTGLYYSELYQKVPPSLRYGVIPRHLVHEWIPDYKRFDQELKRTEINSCVALLNKLSQTKLDTMTAHIFFKYCKIAYWGNGKKKFEDFDPRLSGKELYSRYADGRDEGLKKIDPQSEQAFINWYENRSHTGHPWEIYRGGNSTHIDLGVTRSEDKKSWSVYLAAFSSSRLVETCRIMLAFQKAGLPFNFYETESYLKRLMGEDLIGIVPEGDDLRYGWQDFPKEWVVSDTIYFSWFKDENNKSVEPLKKIKKAVCWFPLSVVRTKK